MSSLEKMLASAGANDAARAAAQAARETFTGLTGFQTFAVLGGMVLFGVVLAAVLAARAGR